MTTDLLGSECRPNAVISRGALSKVVRRATNSMP